MSLTKKIEDFFDETGKFAFISSIVVMLITHGFCFANLMYSHDSLKFYDTGGLNKVGVGRWLYPFIAQRRLMATPWLIGLLSILYVSLAVVLVTKLFKFTKIQGLCVALLFGTNITLTSLFCTYMHDADADCLAILFACLAVYGFKNFPRIVNIVVPIISLVLCLALYQAYISVAVGLFVILLIQEVSYVSAWKGILSVIFLGVKELLILIFATICYIPLMYAASIYYEFPLYTESYNGAGKLSSLELNDILASIPKAYKYFRNVFLNINEYNTVSMTRINWIMIMILVISVILYIIVKKKFLGSLVILIPCVLIMPLALSAICLVSFGVMHYLMIFAFCLIYLLPLVVLSSTEEITTKNEHYNIILLKKITGMVSVLLIMAVGFNNIIYANGAYVHKKLVYDNTAFHAQTIWKDINSIDGYIEGETPVVFMGSFTGSKAAYDSSVGKRYMGVLTGVNSSAITSEPSARNFYYAILGRELDIVFDDVEIMENDEYTDMPIYPSNGYCRMIGDKVVVKMASE